MSRSRSSSTPQNLSAFGSFITNTAEAIKAQEDSLARKPVPSLTQFCEPTCACVYTRYILTGFTKLYRTATKKEPLDVTEGYIVIKFGEQGALTGRQNKHNRDFNDGEMIDTFPTPFHKEAEAIVKGKLSRQGLMYSGRHANKSKDDTELYVVRSSHVQEDYFKLARIIYDAVQRINLERSTVEVERLRLEQLELSRDEAQKDRDEARAEAHLQGQRNMAIALANNGTKWEDIPEHLRQVFDDRE